jgi:hypothetical protein
VTRELNEPARARKRAEPSRAGSLARLLNESSRAELTRYPPLGVIDHRSLSIGLSGSKVPYIAGQLNFLTYLLPIHLANFESLPMI